MIFRGPLHQHDFSPALPDRFGESRPQHYQDMKRLLIYRWIKSSSSEWPISAPASCLQSIPGTRVGEDHQSYNTLTQIVSRQFFIVLIGKLTLSPWPSWRVSQRPDRFVPLPPLSSRVPLNVITAWKSQKRWVHVLDPMT